MKYKVRLDDIDAVAKLIRAERLAQNLTRDELACATGLSPKFISHVEGAKPTAQMGKVLHLLVELGVTLYAHSAVGLSEEVLEKATVRRRVRYGS